ncbi:glycosyl transferase family 28 [Ancylobacter sp. Lp-2]|uniref:glycosyltransferase n=1 Tax=Ancylobacter sp. Lp-2 TaxID=2881339 RepID=UPI001E51D4BF|nr:glycosyltransferase [Ancylobacter sp. Lp-2]MCB4768300.1 glycosyl transferase family 28 [Ancylobacter sp. Lp-2]
MSDRSVFIAVTHLLGVGHLARMAALGRILAAEGWRVVLASGGRPNPTVRLDGCELVQLPPLHCVGADFATLLMPNGQPVDDAYLARRTQELVDAFDHARPDVLITELFPFGRRSLAGEFEALLQRAHIRHPRPAVLCSIRDVLNPPSRPEKAESALARLAAYYDGVLFHGDADIVPLSASWPTTPALIRRVKDTGYLHDGNRVSDDGRIDGRDEIVVSGGGSTASLPLARATLAAAAKLPAHRWRLLVGQGVPEADFAALVTAAPSNLIVERARPDFPLLLRRAALSISQAGYNTVMDLAAAGARALLVPFAEGGEREQTLRAAELERRGLARVIPTVEIDGDRLATAATALLERPRPDWSGITRDGAVRAARLVGEFAGRAAGRAEGRDRLDAALARARAMQRQLHFWWRDDDAVMPSAALDRLLDRTVGRGIPLALATIPARATPELARRLSTLGGVDMLVHGWGHANHAPADAKKAEFGAHRPLSTMTAEAVEGLERVTSLFGGQAVPVFVPPWNRVDPALLAALPGCGFRAVSTFQRRKARYAAPGLLQLNTHLDPIAWRQGGGLADEGELLDNLARLIEEELAAAPGVLEPIGLLTHHLVHDGWIDRFLDELVDRLLDSGVANFVGVREVLGAGDVADLQPARR